ncbi:thioredoxin family protein [Poseidonocella sp. HB161398]|uniref:thioredoxin family protein n=1 Tax=Poseidonocella sp. HB161398 TaxID=2320855 RepID=UPI0035175D01
MKLNTQEHQAAGAKYGIRGIPTMVAFARGKECRRQSGAQRSADIVSWVKSV